MLTSHKMRRSLKGVEIASSRLGPHRGAPTPSARGTSLPCEGPSRSTCRQESLPPGAHTALGGRQRAPPPSSGGPSTDLLEDLRAEPRQNLDTVLGEIVDHPLPLPVADHAEVAA